MSSVPYHKKSVIFAGFLCVIAYTQREMKALKQCECSIVSEFLLPSSLSSLLRLLALCTVMNGCDMSLMCACVCICVCDECVRTGQARRALATVSSA